MDEQYQIKRQILDAFSSPLIRHHTLIFLIPSDTVSLSTRSQMASIMFRHPLVQGLQIKAEFGKGCPVNGVQLTLVEDIKQNRELEGLILELGKKNMNKSLRQILEIILHFLNHLQDSNSKFALNSSRIEPPTSKIQSLLFNLSEHSNHDVRLSWLLRLLIREMLDQFCLDKHSQNWKDLQIAFIQTKDLVKAIYEILNNQQFSQKMKDQLQNGRFISRIIQSSHGLKTKKFLIENCALIEKAVYNPDSLFKWEHMKE